MTDVAKIHSQKQKGERTSSRFDAELLSPILSTKGFDNPRSIVPRRALGDPPPPGVIDALPEFFPSTTAGKEPSHSKMAREVAAQSKPETPRSSPRGARGRNRSDGGMVSSSPKRRLRHSSAAGSIAGSTSGPSGTFAAVDSFFESLKLEVDALSVLLFVTALSTRFYKLEEPRAVVFDELNFGKFASHYLNGIFFFDANPPLGKMFIALAGRYAGFDGQFNLDKIGAEYPPTIPLWHLRFVPAFCGSLLSPLTYHLLLEVGCSSWTASLGAVLIILDNALLVQSRFILLDSILLCCISFAFVSLLKVIKSRPFSLRHLSWLTCTGLSVGLAFSVKYSAVYTWMMCVAAVCVDFWRRQLPDLSLSSRSLAARACVIASLVVALPLFLYSFILSGHVMMLTKAGPHDHIMTSAFQASLEGGLASIVEGQPPFIKIGSQITLRNSFHHPACWLHSHQHFYPIKYPDNRGSSHQQQVTCYPFKDVNNWWIVKSPRTDVLPTDPDELRPLENGDVIQIIHGMTGRSLNSHDVAAPLTPENQEVSCYVDYNVSMPAQNLWRLEVEGAEAGDDAVQWRPISSRIRLVHVETKQALKSTGKMLPDWGFHQLEVTTDRVTKQNPTLWNVEEHQMIKSGDQEQGADEEVKRKRDLLQSDFIPSNPVSLGLFEKVYELQVKMITTIHDIPKEHRFGSTPSDWPLLDTTVGYWASTTSHSQIHLIGNPIIWRSAFLAILFYFLFLALYLLLIRRGWITIPSDTLTDAPTEENVVEDEDEDLDDVEGIDDAAALLLFDWWSTFRLAGWLFVGGYCLHFVPYFVYDHTLFLHHYIPALYFKILCLAFLVDHVGTLFSRLGHLQHLLTMGVAVWVFFVFDTFKTLSPLTYGEPGLTAEALKKLQTNDNWDFVYH